MLIMCVTRVSFLINRAVNIFLAYVQVSVYSCFSHVSFSHHHVLSFVTHELCNSCVNAALLLNTFVNLYPGFLCFMT